MPDLKLMDQAYSAIMHSLVVRGTALHYTELAGALSLSPEQGRETLRELVGLGVPGVWLAEGTDYVSSFAPFSNLPTQYRISLEGKQAWFGQ